MLQRLKQNIKDQNNKIILKGHIKKIKLQVPKPLKWYITDTQKSPRVWIIYHEVVAAYLELEFKFYIYSYIKCL